MSVGTGQTETTPATTPVTGIGAAAGERDRPRFADEAEGAYRPIAGSALLALACGVFSLLAFGCTTYEWAAASWTFAAVAVLFCLLTVRRLWRARREYAGLLYAQAGLLLAVVALVGAPPQTLLTWWLINREAKQTADKYVDSVLSNRMLDAIALRCTGSLRASVDDPAELVQRIGNDRYRMFLGELSNQLYAGKGEAAQVTFLGSTYRGYNQGAYTVVHHYKVSVDSPQAGKPDEFQLVLQTDSADVTGQGRMWEVKAVHSAGWGA